MPATFDWESDHGTATGSPSQGTTRSTGRTDTNWKNIDDATSSVTSNPVTAGNNSYEIFMFGKFSGTFTTIQTGLWAHTAGTLGAGLTLNGNVSSTYTTPSTTTNASLTTNMTSAISIGSGQTVLFVATGPQTGSPSSSCSTNPCYTQYLISQMQTTTSASAGNSTTITMTLNYQES